MNCSQPLTTVHKKFIEDYDSEFDFQEDFSAQDMKEPDYLPKENEEAAQVAITTPSVNAKLPLLDLKRAAIVQAHMNVRAHHTDNEKDSRVQIAELRKAVDSLINEKNYVCVKLENQFVLNQKLNNEIKYLRKVNGETSRINSLLVRSHAIQSKRWERINSHFEYLQEFYNTFSKYVSQDGFDPKVVGFDMRMFKEGFKTERQYNPDIMADIKSANRDLSDRPYTPSRPLDSVHGQFGNTYTDENDPLNRTRAAASDLDRKAAILKIARDVYTNKQISGMVNDPRNLCKLDPSSAEKINIRNVYSRPE